MSARPRTALPAVKRWLLPGSLFFSRLLTVRAARAALSEHAAAVAPNAGKPKQLLADVSVIAHSDAGTGIQRVVRELLRQLIAHPPRGYEVRPIVATRQRGFRYAEDYRCTLLGTRKGDGPTGTVRVQAGDIFLGMDLAGHTLPRHHVQLGRWKVSGVKFYFLVYDLLPVLHPEWFNKSMIKSYRDWMRTVAIFADGAVCISRSVAVELTQWLAGTYGTIVSDSLPATWFHLGSNIVTGNPAAAQSKQTREILNRIGKRPAILMVGTIEPRKGYPQTLAAFELVWRKGIEVNLVIVGKTGWRIDATMRRLRQHAEAGKRLHWIEHASDEMLSALYAHTDGLLLASEGEGFGLPIIEAARYGKPLLLRDIPVFREVAGDNAHYFAGNSAESLASEISVWLDLMQAGRAISSAGINPLTWQESARKVIDCLGLKT